MQAWSGQNIGGVSSPTRKLLTIILSAFSLAGLVIGFAVGGFTHPRSATPNPVNPIKQVTVVVHATATTTPTATTGDLPLDPPTITTYTFSEKADGTTSYTLSAQPLYKDPQRPIDTASITCRLWLTKDLDKTNAALKAKNYAVLKKINDLDQPLEEEVANGLTFTAPSLQVQPCVANGPTTWTYTLSQTVKPGSYYIYILADWKGIHFNWNARLIQVKN